MDLRNVYKLFKKKKNFFRGRYLRNKSERQKTVKVGPPR